MVTIISFLTENHNFKSKKDFELRWLKKRILKDQQRFGIQYALKKKYKDQTEKVN